MAKLILVTGAPRSGTTVVGSVLVKADHAAELYEPLSPVVGLEEIVDWYPVPGTASLPEARVEAIVEALSRPKARFHGGTYRRGSLWMRLAKRLAGGSRTRRSYWRCRLTPGLRTIVWKDPNAIFLSARLARDHAIPVVVTRRPVHALAASFKRLGWNPDTEGIRARLESVGWRFPDLADLPGLAGPDALSPQAPVARRAAVMAYLMDAVIRHWRAEGMPIRVVDVDRIIADPHGTYRAIAAHCGVEYTPRMDAFVASLYDKPAAGPAVPGSSTVHSHRNRDVAAVNSYWSKVLDPDEVALCDALAERLEARWPAAGP